MADWTVELVAARIVKETSGLLGEDVRERQIAIIATWLDTLLAQERRKSDLQIDEIRKAWDMIDGWVGCETRSDPVADKEIQDGVETMIKALNPRTNKPLEELRHGVNCSCSPPCALKRYCESVSQLGKKCEREPGHRGDHKGGHGIWA